MDLAGYWRDVRPFPLASVPLATAPSTPPPPPRPNRQDLVLEQRLPSTPSAPPKDYRYLHPRPPTLDLPTPPLPARPTRPYRPLPLAGPSNPSPPRHNKDQTIEDLSDSMSRTSLRRRAPSNGMHRVFGSPPRRHLYGPPSITEDENLSINSYRLEVLKTGNLPPRPEHEMIDPAEDPTGSKAYEAAYRYETAMQQWRQARREARNRSRMMNIPSRAERVYRDQQRARREKEREEGQDRLARIKRLEKEYKEERRTDVIKFAMRKQIEEMKVELAKEKKGIERIKAAKERVDEKMEEDLTCSVCSGIMVEAHQTNPCGHVACGTCLVNWLQTLVQESKTPSCFLCRTNVDLRVPILPVRAIDDLGKTWLDGKNEAGEWPLYEDYLERQKRWSAWKQVHPKLFDPELFPETVAPPPTRRQLQIPGEFPMEFIDDELDPNIGMGLIEGLFNMVDEMPPPMIPLVPYQPARHRAPTSSRAVDVFLGQLPRRRPRQGIMFPDDFFPRINPYPAPQAHPNRGPTPSLLGARLVGNVQEQIREFERMARENEREIQRHLGLRR